MVLTAVQITSTAAQVQGVLGTFNNATDAFNKNDWPTYGNYLDNDVVAYNLSQPGYTVGKSNVIAYFKSISTGTPADLQFDPTNEITWFPSVYPLAVQGVAKWTHTASHHVKVPINYAFQFSPAKGFLLTVIWAQHLIGD